MQALSRIGILCAIGVVWVCSMSDGEATTGGVDVTGDFASQSMFSSGSITTVYHVDPDGSAARRTMTSGSFGISGSVGADRTAAGTWQLDGDTLHLAFGAESESPPSSSRMAPLRRCASVAKCSRGSDRERAAGKEESPPRPMQNRGGRTSIQEESPGVSGHRAAAVSEPRACDIRV